MKVDANASDSRKDRGIFAATFHAIILGQFFNLTSVAFGLGDNIKLQTFSNAHQVFGDIVAGVLLRVAGGAVWAAVCPVLAAHRRRPHRAAAIIAVLQRAQIRRLSLFYMVGLLISN